MLTAAVESYQAVPPATVQLQPRVYKDLRPMERQREVVDVDVPRGRVGGENTCAGEGTEWNVDPDLYVASFPDSTPYVLESNHW